MKHHFETFRDKTIRTNLGLPRKLQVMSSCVSKTRSLKMGCPNETLKTIQLTYNLDNKTSESSTIKSPTTLRLHLVWFQRSPSRRFQIAFQMAIRLIDKSSGEPIPNGFIDVLHHWLLFNESEIFMEDLWIFWWYLMILVDINCRIWLQLGERCGDYRILSPSKKPQFGSDVGFPGVRKWFLGLSFPHAQNFHSLGGFV